MRTLRWLLQVFALLTAAIAPAADDQGLSTTRLRNWILAEGQQMPDDKSGRCRWKSGESLDFIFSSSNKGNGILLMGGQEIRIYDAHEDGCRYESESRILQIELSAVNKTPLLVLSGMAQWTDDKGKAVIRHEPILVIFALNKQGRLELVFNNDGAEHAEVILVDHASPKGRKQQAEWTDIIQREAEQEQAKRR